MSNKKSHYHHLIKWIELWDPSQTGLSPMLVEDFSQTQNVFFFTAGKLQGFSLKSSALSREVAQEIIQAGNAFHLEVSIPGEFRNPFTGCKIETSEGNWKNFWKNYCEGILSSYSGRELQLRASDQGEKPIWEVTGSIQNVPAPDRTFIHSMNNVIGSIVSFGSLVKKDDTLSKTQAERITWMMESAQKALEMLKERFPK